MARINDWPPSEVNIGPSYVPYARFRAERKGYAPELSGNYELQYVSLGYLPLQLLKLQGSQDTLSAVSLQAHTWPTADD